MSPILFNGYNQKRRVEKETRPVEREYIGGERGGVDGSFRGNGRHER